ncbi:MAG: hypothetical protein WBX15_17085 [Thermoanaerobaculia bacterium]
MWQSELRFYNATAVPQTIEVSRTFPAEGTECTGIAPFAIEPGALAQIRSIGCGEGSAAAFEMLVADGVEVSSVITNIDQTAQTSCCLTGYSQNIPIVDADRAYELRHSMANLQVPVVGRTNLGRHNLVIVNPSGSPLIVTLLYYEAHGLDGTVLFQPQEIAVPARAYTQVGDVLPQLHGSVTEPIITGYWRIDAAGDRPFFILDSYVDNATNDATTIEAGDR